MLVHALTDIGLERKENEDFYCLDQDRGLFIIADGMGGHAGGEVASATAVKVIRDHFIGVTEENYQTVLGDLFSLANQEIYEIGKAKKHLKGMGTTLIALVVKDDKIFIAHVGDSRVYRLRAGELAQLTDDQNIAGRLLRAGKITEDEAMVHPGQSLLTNVLGSSQEFEIDFMAFDFMPGDTILMCTDGLVGNVKAEEIQSCLIHYKDPGKAGQKLLHLALQHGGNDNITMILIKNS